MNISCKRLDLFVRVVNVAAKIGIRSQCGVTQPIVADHPVLVWVRDRASLQFVHGPKCFLDARSHLIEKIVIEFHSTDIDRKIDVVITQEILLETLPKRG